MVFSARDVGREEAWSTNFDLFAVPLDGSRGRRAASPPPTRRGTRSPSFSPDGKTLAYLAMERPGFEADRFRIVLRPGPTGRSAC